MHRFLDLLRRQAAHGGDSSAMDNAVRNSAGPWWSPSDRHAICDRVSQVSIIRCSGLIFWLILWLIFVFQMAGAVQISRRSISGSREAQESSQRSSLPRRRARSYHGDRKRSHGDLRRWRPHIPLEETSYTQQSQTHITWCDRNVLYAVCRQ